MTTLYEPAKVGGIDVKNRVFLAPLTRNRSKPDNTPSDLAAEYYSQRATGGLLITEATQISPEGIGYINTPGIFTEAQVEGWKAVTDAVHAKGGKIVVQLWHVGRISHTSLQPGGQAPLAPSAVPAKAQTFIETGMVDVSAPREMTAEDIKRTIADYRHAAEAAMRAGFDGIEVHAANGYLIDQFLTDGANKRTDAYGGAVENRYRFLGEVLDAVLDVWPADKVGIRLSPTGKFNDVSDSDPAATFSYVVDRLNPLGLAYLHMVEAFPGIETAEGDREVIDTVLGKWNGFYISNGGYEKASGEQAVSSGRVGAVAFGRPFLANPDLPKRLETGAALNEPDQATFYGGGAEGYTDYPVLDQ